MRQLAHIARYVHQLPTRHRHACQRLASYLESGRVEHKAICQQVLRGATQPTWRQDAIEAWLGARRRGSPSPCRGAAEGIRVGPNGGLALRNSAELNVEAHVEAAAHEDA
jgi:hypothetical protein